MPLLLIHSAMSPPRSTPPHSAFVVLAPPTPPLRPPETSAILSSTTVQWVDVDGVGCVTGTDATDFFAMSGLSLVDLKQVGAIVDSKRQGFLGFGQFVAAMQMQGPLRTVVISVIDGLKRKRLYLEKLKPLEVAYRFNDFASLLLKLYHFPDKSDFDAKPINAGILTKHWKASTAATLARV
ncbi:hypothetical protein E2562_025472 [Oryza meyeriana var. granulata]|uniref:EH domain-containing protein n=1 Tax=Oryza meyeriana var. granulata TaxID=110450 RepID=A0A6G1CID1_9ORYZ|nr:hypothetical protein E2562_025472 [Oryza meyeriana var. granulata]